MEVYIRALQPQEQPPMDLLMLADPSVAAIEKYLPQSEILIAEFDNKPIGVCVVYSLTPEHAEIKNIAVAESCQNKGIGKQLLTHTIAWAAGNSFKQLSIGTANSSIQQLYFYQKMGFEMASIKKDFFLHEYSEAIFENGIQAKHMVMLSMIL